MNHSETPQPGFEAGCHQCDLLVAVPPLAPGSRAYCPRCSALITSHIPDQFHRGLALALSAIVLLAVALSFPFLSFESSGLSNSMTLPQTALALYNEGAVALSLLVACFILCIPAMMLVLLMLLTTSILFELKLPSIRLIARTSAVLTPWSFVEVFIIGVIVSLVKLTKMATIVLGISFWAYIAFAICFIAAFASVDRHDIWDAIEARRS